MNRFLKYGSLALGAIIAGFTLWHLYQQYLLGWATLWDGLNTLIILGIGSGFSYFFFNHGNNRP